MKNWKISAAALMVSILIGAPSPAAAENLYRGSSWPNFASDQTASEIGDSLVVLVYQSAEARNSARKSAGKRSDFEGGWRTSVLDEFGEAGFGSRYDGRGEIRRSESLVTSISVTIQEILPNGDFLIVGEQSLHINGEATKIGVRGRIRPVDIASNNTILSTRIANAEISYDGQGFVSRSARPGLINWLFGVLGLGL